LFALAVHFYFTPVILSLPYAVSKKNWSSLVTAPTVCCRPEERAPLLSLTEDCICTTELGQNRIYRKAQLYNYTPFFFFFGQHALLYSFFFLSFSFFFGSLEGVLCIRLDTMECIRDKFVGGLVLDGRFETISPLNHGSFGMVFMAQDLMTNEIVAIKCLTKKAAPGEAGLEFAVDDKSEELALHSNLGSHDNIVNLLHSFETDAHVYLVMEFCSQGDLYEAIRNGHGPLQTEHVRQFMLQLVDAVTYIHSKGVYHRDIKPENIFLTQDGAVKPATSALQPKTSGHMR